MKCVFRIIRRIAVLTLIVGLCSGFAIVKQGYDLYQSAIEAVSLEDQVESVRAQDSYTKFDELPETYVNAVIAVEDHRFYDHCGIDLIAICRAALHDIQAGSFVEGGSTIPQQLAKNLYFTQEKELTRKVAEALVALDLKKSYSDEEIFELYVNSIYFGDGYYDIASASEGYFGKEPQEMTEYECTLLAGVPNSPARYSPSKHPEQAAKRQLLVVRRLEACGYLSAEEAETVAETAAQIALME